jgi:hypothetical protein
MILIIYPDRWCREGLGALRGICPPCIRGLYATGTDGMDFKEPDLENQGSMSRPPKLGEGGAGRQSSIWMTVGAQPNKTVRFQLAPKEEKGRFWRRFDVLDPRGAFVTRWKR